jgi:hypothetical protein
MLHDVPPQDVELTIRFEVDSEYITLDQVDDRVQGRERVAEEEVDEDE